MPFDSTKLQAIAKAADALHGAILAACGHDAVVTWSVLEDGGNVGCASGVSYTIGMPLERLRYLQNKTTHQFSTIPVVNDPTSKAKQDGTLKAIPTEI